MKTNKLLLKKLLTPNKICILIVNLLVGCTPVSSVLSITYKSEPSSATLFQNNKNFGHTPVTLNYKLTNSDLKLGYKVVEQTNVRWASGITAFHGPQKIFLSDGYNQEYTFIRPQGASDTDLDVHFTLGRVLNLDKS